MTGINEKITPFLWKRYLNFTFQFLPINHKFSVVPIKIPTRIFMELEI